MNDRNTSSGFTENLDRESSPHTSMPIENAYRNLGECYVSKTGHTRLFTANKYGKRYVLKCLKKDFLYTPIYQQALTKEFEIGLQLEHPNICRTIGLEQLPDLGTTIVMEYIDGDTLQALIDRKLLTVELAHKITRQLMDALEYMHSKQMIHRDLKPSNIMVTHTGQNTKIIDLGLSDSDAFYILKIPAGTSGYIAPEQFLPGAKAEPRTDIYSLGKVIGDMAKTTGDKFLEKMAKHCCVEDPKLRPDSIEKVRNLSYEPPRLRSLVILLSIIAFILLCIIGFSYLIRHQETTAREDSYPQEHTDEKDSSAQNDNKVMDYEQWDK